MWISPWLDTLLLQHLRWKPVQSVYYKTSRFWYRKILENIVKIPVQLHNYNYFFNCYCNISINGRNLKGRLKQSVSRKYMKTVLKSSYDKSSKRTYWTLLSDDYRGLWHILRCSYGIRVKRDSVIKSFLEIDSERWTKMY